jgi:integrase
VRTVPLSDRAATVLDRLSRRKHHTGAAALVFCRPDGQHLDPSGVRNRYMDARDAARADDGEIPVLRFHELRHTFGSLCAAGGIDVVSIQRWMGHRDIQTTMIYMHFAESSEDADRVTRAMGGPVAASVEPERLRR